MGEIGKQTGSSSKGNLSANECLQLGLASAQDCSLSISGVFALSPIQEFSQRPGAEGHRVYCGIRVVPHTDVGNLASLGTSWPVAVVPSALKQNC